MPGLEVPNNRSTNDQVEVQINGATHYYPPTYEFKDKVPKLAGEHKWLNYGVLVDGVYTAEKDAPKTFEGIRVVKIVRNEELAVPSYN